MVVFPLDFEILNESIPINFKESTAPLSVDFREVEVVSDYMFIGLTDPEIELLNTMLTDGAAISVPEMTATIKSYYGEPDPETGLLVLNEDVTATITNIDKEFIVKAEVGFVSGTGTIISYDWHDAEITFGDTAHIVSYHRESTLVFSYAYVVVKLTYYYLFGEISELTVKAVKT